MTDKSDLIGQIKLHVGFMKDCDNWVSDDHHSNVIKKLCIESDEAREYWRGQDYDIQQRAVQLAVLVERTRFIDQACEAVEVRKNKLLEINESMPAKEQAMLVAGLCEAEQALRNMFEGEK